MKRFSLKWKLTLIIFTVAAVVIALLITLFTIYDANTYRRLKQQRISTIADIVANNSTPALTFRDRDDALSVLRSLRSDGSIRAAYLFVEGAGVLAQYLRDGETLSVPLLNPTADEGRFEPDSYILVRPVVFEGKRLGALYIDSDLQNLQARSRERLQLGSIAAVSTLLLALLLSFGLQSSFTRPINELQSLLEEITKTSDYSKRAPNTFKDEFAELADGLNHMLQEIEAQAKQINIQLALVEHSNKELDQFVYVASHDLKAPLRAVDNLAQLITKAVKDVLPPDKQEYLTLLHGRIKRMERLLDDLLAYSRVGRIETKAESVDTRALLKDVIELMKPPERFTITIPDTMPVLRTVKTPLEQVLRNLLGNAIKHHNRPNGKIDVTCRDLPTCIEFTITDDGPGIAPQYHEKIFQMFQTLKPRDEVEGSGMGLAMVKKIVEDQKGHITLRSSDGAGASFTFTWPKKE